MSKARRIEQSTRETDQREFEAWHAHWLTRASTVGKAMRDFQIELIADGALKVTITFENRDEVVRTFTLGEAYIRSFRQ